MSQEEGRTLFEAWIPETRHSSTEESSTAKDFRFSGIISHDDEETLF